MTIVYSMCQWKNFENRLIFGEDKENDKVGRFLWDTNVVERGVILVDY